MAEGKTRSGRHLTGIVVGLLVGLAAGAPVAAAQEFPMFGARALGMGRSGVASVNDHAAVYVNPAGLARPDGYRLTIPMVGAGFFSPDDVKETQDIIDDIVRADLSSPTAPQFVVDQISRLRDDPRLGAEGRAMIAFGVPHGFTLSYTERAILDVRVAVDRIRVSTNPASPNFVANNRSRGVGGLVWLRQAGLSWATALPLAEDRILIGATGLVGHATSFYVDETLFNLSQGQEIDWLDRIKHNRATSFYGDLIVGTQVQLLRRRLTLGVTANHLLRPRIDRVGDGDFKLDPQVRLGVAFSPCRREPGQGAPDDAKIDEPRADRTSRREVPAVSDPLTLTFDFDLTRNSSTLPGGIDSRHIGGGIEYVPSPGLAFRAGLYANLEERGLGPTITLGARLAWLDLGFGYSTQNADSIANDVRAEIALDVRF